MRLLALLIGVLVLGGCVTKEIYNAQVIRTNNFQRQLAEEEKHSVDLAAEIARLKIQIAELEAQNRTLTTKLNEAKARCKVRILHRVNTKLADTKLWQHGYLSHYIRDYLSNPASREFEQVPIAA